MSNEKKMCVTEAPCCPHCGATMKKWRVPMNSTWESDFQWICFNDDCEYFIRGWDWMMSQHQVRASYRCRIDPMTGKAHPMPVWSYKALKDDIIED
jgi:hypothetical protein